MTAHERTSEHNPRNPFEYGRELSRSELVDRERELSEIAGVIRNRGKLFLIGPRRFGKTSLLHAAAVEAEEEGAVVLRFDAEKYETLSVLAQALLTAAVRSLKGPIERTLKLIANAASRLRPRITMDAEGKVSVGLTVESRTELPVLADVLDAIEALAAESERATVVILDEIQEIVIEHGEAAEKQLRATVQRHRHTSYLFAGSSVRLLNAMTSKANRPFYRLGARLFLDALPRPDFMKFLHDGFQRSGFAVEQGGLAAILDSADDVPYNVQRLAHEIWELQRAGEVTLVTPAAVREAALRIVQKEDPAYTQIWTQLSRNQKKALKAVIAHQGANLQSAAVTGEYGLSTSSMQTALKSLEDAHLIRMDEGRERSRYRLIDPFVATWLDYAQAAL